jgi:hypothetical protein
MGLARCNNRVRSRMVVRVVSFLFTDLRDGIRYRCGHGVVRDSDSKVRSLLG